MHAAPEIRVKLLMAGQNVPIRGNCAHECRRIFWQIQRGMDGSLSAGVCLFVLLALQADLVYSSLLLPPQAGKARRTWNLRSTRTGMGSAAAQLHKPSSLLYPLDHCAAGSLRHGARAIATETCGARSSSETAVPPYNLLEHDALDYAQQHHSSTPPAFAPVDENVCLVAGELLHRCLTPLFEDQVLP